LCHQKVVVPRGDALAEEPWAVGVVLETKNNSMVPWALAAAASAKARQLYSVAQRDFLLRMCIKGSLLSSIVFLVLHFVFSSG
jgi:hypothetical protein